MRWFACAIAAVATIGGTAAASTFATSARYASKPRIAIDARGRGGAATFTYRNGADAVKDRGSVTAVLGSDGPLRLRDGQEFRTGSITETFVGKKGTFRIRSRQTQYSAGSGRTVFTGTWSFVSGSGIYAGVRGGGRSAGVYASGDKSAFERFEGFITGA
jgi:hypothetical protein